MRFASSEPGLRIHPWVRRAAACATLLGLSGLASLSGCGSALLAKPAPAPVLFTLDSLPAAKAGPAAPARVLASGTTLSVNPPQAAPGYDSARMVYTRAPHQIEHFALHQWVDAPAQMLAPLLVRALQSSGAFGAVLGAPSLGQGEIRLETTLLRLEQDFSSAPSQVRLTLRAVLVHSASRRVLASREFDASQAAPSDDPRGGASAANLALQRVLADLVAFCVAAVAS